MQTFTQLPQYYQAPNGTTNPQIRWGKCVGFRAAPTPPPGTNSPTKFYWPRTVRLNDGVSGGVVTIGDSGWIAGDFTSLSFNPQDKGAGTALQDWWNVWIAEDDDDMLIAPGSSFTAGLVYDAASGLYTSQGEFNGVVSGSVSISGGQNGTAGSDVVVANPASTSSVSAAGAVTDTAAINISTLIGSGSGVSNGILVSNSGAAGKDSLQIQEGGNIIALLPPGASQFLNIDPRLITIYVEATTATGTTYGAIAYYGT